MTLLIYGASGYTGALIAETAQATLAARLPGTAPTIILGGRRADVLTPLGERVKLPTRVFTLDDPAQIDAGLAGVKVVLNCAGPFSRTAMPLAQACLRARAHYLDITGEIAVFEALSACHAQAQAAGVMLLPGVGFDVVPSDCLAAHVAQRLPSATRLTLAIEVKSRTSHGTATTMVENVGQGGMIRRDGKLTPVPAGWRTRVVDLGEGPKTVISLPWGDVATAFHTTGIPNIEVYFAGPAHLRLGLKATRFLGPLLATAPVQRLLKARIKAGPAGPNERHRGRSEARLWAEARDDQGRSATARLRTPEAYELTRLTALNLAARALRGDVKPGFATPAGAYGKDLVLEIPGVVRTDL
jgi:short subunit dehydrogenase-like uncharacterized protein